MSSEQMPPEFEWIKPGVQVELKEDAWHGRDIGQPLTVITDPYLPPNFDHWVVECAPDFGLLMWCDELEPAKNPTITLILTREQAEALLKGLNTGYLEDGLKMAEIKKQIEDKLK